MTRYAATLVISTYKDFHKLRCILETLTWQSNEDFEIIISEDGCCDEIADVFHRFRDKFKGLAHLSQDDIGFRKNRALNRAICAARSDYIVFIDGDCVPHSRFIDTHLAQSRPNAICVGRRVELGPIFTQRLVDNPAYLCTLENRWKYILLARQLNRDAVKNYEVGIVSPVLNFLGSRKIRHIVGCNFSCSRRVLEKINGFNEEFESPGFGEDSDIEWRLLVAGYELRNIKFLAPVYHLHHVRAYEVSRQNFHIMNCAQAENSWRCRRGLDQVDCNVSAQ